LDVMTLLQDVGASWEALAGQRLVIVGDVLHSRVVGSLLPYLHAAKVEIVVVAPPYFMPSAEKQAELKAQYNLHFEDDLTVALRQARFVYGLRIQHERLVQRISLESFTKAYQLTPELLRSLAHPAVKFMHPGPVNRGVEATSALVDDAAFSLVRQQVHNGVFVRMAVLDWCFAQPS
jgi:aspartate carbamoyltransferase catalytic subunit